MKPIRIVDHGRGPQLSDVRITVYDIIPYLEAGRSPNYIAAVLSLGTAEVEALMQYIEEHNEEVMAVHRRIEERIARGNPPEVEAMREESHKRLLALRDELRRRRTEESSNGASNPG